VNEIVNDVDRGNRPSDVGSHLKVTLDDLNIVVPRDAIKAVGLTSENAN
jgi:hypothetical protein